MINNIKKLLASNLVSNYKISKDTGISQSTLSDYLSGKTEIGKMPLERGITLNNYYIKLKEMEKMKLENLQELVKENVHVSEENGKFYAIVVEENGDEHDLAQANKIEELHEQLKQFQQIK